MKKKRRRLQLKINKTRSWFFENINKIYKPLTRLIKEKGRRIKSIKLEMKIQKTQQTTQKYKRSWAYYEQLYDNKMDNLKEMDKFLEKYNLSKLNQKEIENLNRPITSTEIETIIIKSSNKQKPKTRRFHQWMLQKL